MNRTTTAFVPCEQLSLKAGRYATKDEKPQRAIVCFSMEHVPTSKRQMTALPLDSHENVKKKKQ